jgi:hypothetical protein
MNEQEARELEQRAADAIDESVRVAFQKVIADIQAGVEPRTAVQNAMDGFSGEMAAIMADGLSKLLSESIGSREVTAITVGGVSLSRHLYAESRAVSESVQGIVQRHVRGFQDARALALELFQGYGFRQDEPLKFNPTNQRLPKYLREALLSDQKTADELSLAFARIQVDKLSTPALQAAYRQLLDAIDKAEASGAGKLLLEKRINIAFYERVRYFAVRIARTELHRAYAAREVDLIMADVDIEYVQIRRAPGRQEPCICVLMTGRNLYKLGPGVYPKAKAPIPPFHPFCMCVMSPRLDLTGKTAAPRDDEGDAYFLRRVGEKEAGYIMGSQAKRDRVFAGASAESVANSGKDPLYMIRTPG